MLTIKIRKIAKYWGWSLLGSAGQSYCTGTALFDTPSSALNDALQLWPCDEKVSLPDVGGAILLQPGDRRRGIPCVRVWRHS